MGSPGLCQHCQDVVWLGRCDEDDGGPPQQYLVRRGVVFAHSRERCESALVPFVFGAVASPAVGWDLGALLRVGPSCRQVDPTLELSSLCSYTLTHRVGVTTVDSPAHPLLDCLQGTAVVVGFESVAMVAFVDACPALRASAPALHQLAMHADDSSERLVDFPSLVSGAGLDPGYDPSVGPPGALRLCAWAVAALHIPDADRMLLHGVLAPHRRRAVPDPQPASSAPLH